jgi:hypothetical protein
MSLLLHPVRDVTLTVATYVAVDGSTTVLSERLS